jgi:hypothetical protein
MKTTYQSCLLFLPQHVHTKRSDFTLLVLLPLTLVLVIYGVYNAFLWLAIITFLQYFVSRLVHVLLIPSVNVNICNVRSL